MAAARGSALLASVEALFASTESIVVAAFQAQKVSRSSESTGSQLLKALGAKVQSRDVLRPAVIVFTVRRSLSDRGFLASLHFARPAADGGTQSGGARASSSGGKLELRKSYPLKSLHDVRITPLSRSAAASKQQQQEQLARAAKAGGQDQQQQQVLEVRCASHHNTPEHRGRYVLPDLQAAMFVASLAIQLLRQQDAVLPAVVGVPLERLDGWWAAHRHEATQALSTFALEVVTPGAIVVGRAGDEAASVLVSDKEAVELEELLALFKLGLGEADQFASALQEEAAALEAANVYAILQAGPLVDGVLGDLRVTQGVLDDLDESLKVFDLKLRHMRDDIAAIEASNNSLEAAAAHNAALRELLVGLLDALALEPGLAGQLERPALDPFKLQAVVLAAWQLHAQRQRLSGASPDALSPTLSQMRVVREAQEQLDELAARFVGKVLAVLSGLMRQLVGEALADAGGGGSHDRTHRLTPPGRQQLHATLRRHVPLIQVIAALEPRALQQLQQQVCQEMNGLLRRELRVAGSELRRGAAAELSSDGAAGHGDYSLARERQGGGPGSPPMKRVSRLSGASTGSDAADDPLDAAELAAGAAGMLGAGAARRAAAFVDGAAAGIPLHEAWALLLGNFLPFLAAEAAFLADVLLMYSGDAETLQQGLPALEGEAPRSPTGSSGGGGGGGLRARYHQQQQQQQQQAPPSARQGSAASLSGSAVPLEREPGCPLTYDGLRSVELLLSGLEGEFTGLSELCSRSHQVLALPLLALCRAWHAQLSGEAAARPLVQLMSSLGAGLQRQWDAFVQQQAAAVVQYDGRSKMGLQQGIKHVHVFPFVSQFCLLAHDLEAAVAAGVAAAAAVAARQRRDSSSRSGGAGEEDDLSPRQQQQPAGIAASIRQDADALYAALCPRLLARVERLAEPDAKYADRCRLENYAYVGQALARLAGRVPALQQHWQVAEARHRAALAAYVQDQLQYSKLWRLLELGDRLEALLKVVSPPEVPFQRDCSAADVRGLMRAVADGGLDKKLEAMAARVRKHLGSGPVFDAVWAALKDTLLARYERLEQLVETCYPTTPLRPSPEELRELFRATSAG